MAKCFTDIKVVAELRPCVYGCEHRKALFHRWENRTELISPSLMVGGHGGGTVSRTLAIIELEDGTIMRCAPEDIRFTDSMCEEYCFKWDGEEK